MLSIFTLVPLQSDHGAGHGTEGELTPNKLSYDLSLILIFLLLIFYVLSSSIISHYHIGWIHPAGLLVLVSAILSLSLEYVSILEPNAMQKIVSRDFIYKMLLPPIVLAEGFNVKQSMLRNFGREIKLLGIGQAMFSPLLLTLIIYLWAMKEGTWMFGLDSDLSLSVNLLETYMLAITFTTVDPHGTVGPLHGGIHNERMTDIIFGSALFNNNICLIFVMALEKLVHGGDDGILANFIKTGALSMVFGLFMGAVVTIMMKNSSFLHANPVYEVFMVVVWTYATYMLAHLKFFQLSADVAIFFYGFIQSNYNIYNMSREAIRQLGVIINVVAQAAEAFCFIYVGMSVEDTFNKGMTNLKISIIFFLLTLGVRFLLVLVAVFWKMKKERINQRMLLNLNISELYAFCSAGMVKGPVAYIFGGVLVSALHHELDGIDNIDESSPLYSSIRPLYIVQQVVLLSILLWPPIHYLACRTFIEPEHSDQATSERNSRYKAALSASLSNSWNLDPDHPQTMLYLDEFFIKPTLVRDYKEKKSSYVSKISEFNEVMKIYEHGHSDTHTHGPHTAHSPRPHGHTSSAPSQAGKDWGYKITVDEETELASLADEIEVDSDDSEDERRDCNSADSDEL